MEVFHLRTTLSKTKMFPLLISLILILVFGYILLAYTAPMHDGTVDLSLYAGGKHNPQQSSDNKGWTIYTQEGDLVSVLQNDGKGRFPGIGSGQTLYMSRTLVAELESPSIQIATENATYIIWLDGEVIYSDHPELDPVPGQLRLPMHDGYRSEPITLNLPAGYRGMTLTIAQSTPEVADETDLKAIPTTVKLVCGFAYESGIVAEAYSLAMIAGGLFALGLLLVIAFLHQQDWSLLCITFNVFLTMTHHIMAASFQGKYYGVTFDFHWFVQWFSADFHWCAELISALVLMTYLYLKAGSKRKWMLVSLLASLVVTPLCVAAYLLLPAGAPSWPRILIDILPQGLFIGTVTAALVFGLLRWRKENRFYRFFTPLTLAVLAAVTLLQSLVREGWLSSLLPDWSTGSHSLLFQLFWEIVTVTALISALWDALKTDLARRAMRNLMEQNREMTLSSYENMRHQHEEVMKLRHDMAEHLEVLHGMTQNADITAYIENLLGQHARVRSVIHTGNDVLDIILGSKLGKAQDHGILVEINRCSAPSQLPIPDTDLSSIVINILTNAIKGAENSGAAKPTIALDIHTRDEWLSITCENTADIRQIKAPAKKETVPKHGLGLKIIQESVQRNNGLFQAEYGDDYYKVSVILPLHEN